MRVTVSNEKLHSYKQALVDLKDEWAAKCARSEALLTKRSSW